MAEDIPRVCGPASGAIAAGHHLHPTPDRAHGVRPEGRRLPEEIKGNLTSLETQTDCLRFEDLLPWN